ncbi:MAG: hypothetical protein WBD27_11755 [Pyrinomonadaceae bacterium]
MKHVFIYLIAVLVCSPASFAQAGSKAGRVDLSFNVDLRTVFPRPKPIVRAIAVQPDGKTLIAGNFRTVTPDSRSDLIRLNADDTVDTTFNVTLGGAGGTDVTDIALQSDGRIVIGGGFWSVNGVEKYHMARLNADGSLDNSFTPSSFLTPGGPRHFKIRSDGKFAVGIFSLSGSPVTIRLNSNGSLDTTFGNPPFEYINGGTDLAVDSSNRTYVCLPSHLPSYFVRFNNDGSRDTSFVVSVTQASGNKCGVRELTNGRLLVWGPFTAINGVARNGLAMLDPDGSLVTSFVPEINAPTLVSDIELQPDGRIFFVGYDSGTSFSGRIFIGRLNADGSLDSTWHRGRGVSFVYDNDSVVPIISKIKVRDARKLLIGGKFFRYDGIPRAGLMQIRL